MSAGISMLELRRIEANILKDVYDILRERHGKKEAEEILTKVITSSAVSQGASMAKDYEGRPDLEDFADLIPLWEKDDALKVEILHRSSHKLDFNIRRCRFSEMYQEMGLAEIGHLLSCNRDGAFCTGYNPAMKLTRTQTIMKGADYCDFRFEMKDESK